MNLEGLRETVAKGRSLSRQTSLNPDPIVTLSLREAEALVSFVEEIKEIVHSWDAGAAEWNGWLEDISNSLRTLEAIE